MPPFSSKDFRDVVGAFATGVTVITTRGEGHAYGMTANAFCSVSLAPPLVLVCTLASSEASEHLRRNGVFAVNILGTDHEPLSRFFSSEDRPRGRDAFADVSYRAATSGSPILEGAIAYLDCRLHAEHATGDHVIFIGEVLELGADDKAEPLIFHRGQYRLLGAG